MYVYEEFPKWKYHQDGRAQIVHTLDGELALGAGWGDHPVNGPFADQAALTKAADEAQLAALGVLAGAESGLTAKQLAPMVNLADDDAKALCEQLVADGLVEKGQFGRYYAIPGASSGTK